MTKPLASVDAPLMSPAASSMPPPRPPDASPVVRSIVPLVGPSAVPVRNVMSPDWKSLSAVSTVMVPAVEEVVSLLVVTRTAPPAPFTDVPAVMMMSPA